MSNSQNKADNDYVADISLVGRLVRTAALWVVPALLVTALLLILFYRASIYKNFNDPLENTIQALVAKAEVTEFDPGFLLSAAPIDPRYQLELSGRYWMIGILEEGGKIESVVGSPSLSDASLDIPAKMAANIFANKGQIFRTFSTGPDGEPLSLVAKMVIFNDRDLLFVAAADRRPALQAVRRFSFISLGLMSLLAIGLVLAIMMQVKTGLRPLFELRDRVADIREGRASSVKGQYPKEIKPLAEELNTLIAHNREVVEYARTHVGNLAHALKTPLAVLVNEAKGRKKIDTDIVVRQSEIMSKQVDHHLRRARAASRGQSIGASTKVDEIINSLVRTLGLIYRDRDIEFKIDMKDGLNFRGEKRDLEEMTGNLLDNACKWARRQVHVIVDKDKNNTDRISIIIDDDGKGMSEDQYELVLQRGTRLDETTPGTGFGLSIVNDLAKAYRGDLTLSRSPLGGLRAYLSIPMLKNKNK